MAKPAHTPGPWSVEDPMDFELTIVEANKPTYEWRTIASCSLPESRCADFTKREVEANARLIAACPQVTEALQAICSEFAQTHPLIVKGRAALTVALGFDPISSKDAAHGQ